MGRAYATERQRRQRTPTPCYINNVAQAPQALSEAVQAGEVAPSSLAGWGALQRQTNIRLPYLCKTSIQLARNAVAILGGQKG